MSDTKKVNVENVWGHVINAQIDLETAMHALEELDRLVAQELLNDDCEKLDVDTFHVFALGIRTELQQVKADIDRAAKGLKAAS